MLFRSVDEYEHSHSSLRWLISRGTRATEIRIKRTNLKSDRITDQTFTGIGLLCVQDVDSAGADGIQIHRTIVHTFRNRDVEADTNKIVSVRPQSCRHLISINLSGCRGISDIGISAIAEGCHQLTSIDLSSCDDVSDIGISAIAKGCHQLISINLSYCHGLSDIGLSAIAKGCHNLTNISIRLCWRITEVCLSALGRSYPLLQFDR